MTRERRLTLPKEQGRYEVSLFQDNLDGLLALIFWCDGFEKAGKGEVPGKFDLIMHYRSLTPKEVGYS